MSKNPLVAKLNQSDIVQIAAHVAAMMKPLSPKRKKRDSLKGLFKHSRSGIWYWRFTYQGRRYLVSLKTVVSEPVSV